MKSNFYNGAIIPLRSFFLRPLNRGPEGLGQRKTQGGSSSAISFTCVSRPCEEAVVFRTA